MLKFVESETTASFPEEGNRQRKSSGGNMYETEGTTPLPHPLKIYSPLNPDKHAARDKYPTSISTKYCASLNSPRCEDTLD
eukprot:351493-Hanusia_phi.AAC.2